MSNGCSPVFPHTGVYLVSQQVLPQSGLPLSVGSFAKKIVASRYPSRIKVSFCDNIQRQSCKAFTLLSTCAQNIDGDVPFYLKFLPRLTHPLENRRLRMHIRS